MKNGVQGNNESINFAVEQLLTPQSEQGEAEVLEQENPEEETLEVDDDLEEEVEVEEEEEVGGDLEDDDPLEDDEAPTEEEESPSEEFYTVKVDGEEFEVNLEELKKGYQLEKNYTKKAQTLAEDKKELTSLQEQLTKERDQYIQANAMMAQQNQAVLEKAKAELASIDKDDDPIGFVQKQLEVQEVEQGLRKQIEDYQIALSQQQLVDQQNMQAYLVEQDKILQAELAGWNDPAESQALKEGIMKFATSQGYTQEELSNIKSAKDIITLNKARMYDELMQKKAVVKEKRTPRKPTPKIKAAEKKGGNIKRAQAVKQKRDRLKSSGSVKDAQALMTDLMLRKPIKKR